MFHGSLLRHECNNTFKFIVCPNIPFTAHAIVSCFAVFSIGNLVDGFISFSAEQRRPLGASTYATAVPTWIAALVSDPHNEAHAGLRNGRR